MMSLPWLLLILFLKSPAMDEGGSVFPPCSPGQGEGSIPTPLTKISQADTFSRFSTHELLYRLGR